jgi:hypothetical protein
MRRHEDCYRSIFGPGQNRTCSATADGFISSLICVCGFRLSHTSSRCVSILVTMPLCHLLTGSPAIAASSTPEMKAKKPLVDLSDFPSMSSLDDSLPRVVSPTFSDDTDSLSCCDDDSSAVPAIVKTAHKLAEERGFAQEEPLLKANPNRFVLFPIQDDDVRICIDFYLSYISRFAEKAHTITSLSNSDLENVQASRSLLLDRRGN